MKTWAHSVEPTSHRPPMKPKRSPFQATSTISVRRSASSTYRPPVGLSRGYDQRPKPTSPDYARILIRSSVTVTVIADATTPSTKRDALSELLARDRALPRGIRQLISSAEQDPQRTRHPPAIRTRGPLWQALGLITPPSERQPMIMLYE